MSHSIQRMINQGAWIAAQATISSALANDASQHSSWSLQAELYQKQEQSLLALEALEVALSLAPQTADYHERLAVLYQQIGLMDSSLEHYQAARALQPSLQNTLNLSQALVQQGQRQQALVYTKEALVLDPENAQSYALLGQVMVLFGRFEVAQDAFQQSLSLQEDLSVSLLLAKLLIRQGQFSLALVLLLHWQESSMQSSERLIYLKLLGQCFYWQADFPQARIYWQEALGLGFDLDVFFLASLAGPLFFFNLSEQQNWNELFQASQTLYRDWAEQMPLRLALCPPVIFPFAQRSQARLAFGHHLRSIDSDPDLLGRDPAGLLGLVVSNLSDPEVLSSVWQWFSYAQEPERLRLFYISPADLPSPLAAWAEQTFQAPVHSEALLDFVRGFKLSGLLFFDVQAELYALAARRGAALQVYAPLDAVSSGLIQMDYFLTEPDFPIEAELWTESPLQIEGVYLGQSQTFEKKTRADWGLPRLGHLYLCPVSPDAWGLDFDSVIQAILAQDRKAFLLGLCLPDSSLDTYLSQRLKERLGERMSRRVRWLNLQKQDLPGLISVVDLMLEPPGARTAWAAYQALSQGVPVLAVRESMPSFQQAAHWLKTFSLERYIVPLDDLASSACRIVNSASERVMLVQHLSALEPLDQVSQTRVQTIEKKLYQLMKMDHHARN